jgi:tetraacyldisaccharide 4'-kinase
MKQLLQTALLFPLAVLYGAVVRTRNFVYDALPRLSKNPGKPTISIGGIHAGGTGKTPMALLVGRRLSDQGSEIAFLTRGYKRKLKTPVISAPQTMDSWETVGDEPALLHRELPESWLGVGPDRCLSARRLSGKLGTSSLFILDDGFQHRRIRRDCDIVCLPPNPFADHLLPRGMLREPLSALRRCTALCLIGAPDDQTKLMDSKIKLQLLFPNIPVFILYQEPESWVNLKTGARCRELRLSNPIALCGIARPERFIFLIKKMGVLPVAQSIFKDHHVFTAQEIASVVERTGAGGIVTTEKDAIRLKTLKLADCVDIWYLKIDLHFQDHCSQKAFFGVIEAIPY